MTSQAEASWSLKGSLKSSARLGVWMLEEWLRQLVALGHGLRGRIVVFDRHFFLDYYHADVEGRGRRGLAQRAARMDADAASTRSPTS